MRQDKEPHSCSQVCTGFKSCRGLRSNGKVYSIGYWASRNWKGGTHHSLTHSLNLVIPMIDSLHIVEPFKIIVILPNGSW